jgi:membrane associated rhomboid family serine protease
MRNITPVVKNLILINVVLFIANWGAGKLYQNPDFLINLLGLHYWKSAYFKPLQLVTHMFMHGGLAHIFFNMFALWMFGPVLEQVWGGKRFFIYYMITGLGAASLHLLVNHFQIQAMVNAMDRFMAGNPTPAGFADLIQRQFPAYYTQVYDKLITYWSADPSNPVYLERARSFFNDLLTFRMDIPTVGASGAIFGVLLAFGMLFPNTQLMLLFPPIPMKAKYFVILYGVLELYLGITQPGSQVAHFAHLGGMIFGFVLIKIWKADRKTFF